MKIDLLNAGYVLLVDSMGNDLSVVRSARVSYDAEWRTGEDEGKDEKLINYLIRNRHTSPFESVCLTFEVKAPIFVFRQWHRHRTWAYNEVSARYTELFEEFFIPSVESIGEQSETNKQMRVMTEGRSEMEKRFYEKRRRGEIDQYIEACKAAFRTYHQLLHDGWPRELARAVLPLSTYSKMFATISLHNLMKFWELRSHKHAQPEIQIYSDAMRDLARLVAPVCVSAWNRHKGNQT